MGKRTRLKWQRSSNCPPIACCAEVAETEIGNVLVRSSNNKRRKVVLTQEEWKDLVGAIKAGEYDQIGNKTE